MSDDDDFSLLCETLREEASEQVDRIGAVLVEVESERTSGRAKALLDEAFRQAHNLKGAAGSLGFPLTARLAHAIESALAEVRREPTAEVKELFDLIHQGLSLVPTSLSAGSSEAPHPEVSPFVERLLHVSASLRPARRSLSPDERTSLEVRPREGFAEPPRTGERSFPSGAPTGSAPPRTDADVSPRGATTPSAGTRTPDPVREAMTNRLGASPAAFSVEGMPSLPDIGSLIVLDEGGNPFTPPGFTPPEGLPSKGAFSLPGAPRVAVSEDGAHATVGRSTAAALGEAATMLRPSEGTDPLAGRLTSIGLSRAEPGRAPGPQGPVGADAETDDATTAPDDVAPDEGPAVLRRADESLRVSTKKLSALMAQVGELLAARLRTDQRLSEIRTILATEEELAERRHAMRATLDDLSLGNDPVALRLRASVDESASAHKDLVRRLRELVRAFEADALHSTILSGELQEDIRRIQTFPLSSVLGPLPRAVRNMAREAGKEVELVTEGGDLELDKKVLEALRDPLYHLLRNAVDHGIEAAPERRARQKPEKGRIHLKAEHRGDSITITVEDDGPGVDLDAVRRRARERGLMSEAQALEASEQALLDLLFAPGFTTRRMVGSLSGRGVGLDAVRAGIEALRGNVSVQTRRGRGTLIAITLPLTIYVVHALVLRVGQDELALPISSVQRILRVRPSDVLVVEQSPAILVDDRPVALIPLGSLLGIGADVRSEFEAASVVVVGVGDQRCALVVDEIVGDQTVLAKNLEPPLVRVPNIAGATIRGDGTVLLALSPIDLLRKASALGPDRALSGLEAGSQGRRRKVLLVDDSFTTRALEKGVLEAAGFSVTAVASGEEALEELRGDEEFDCLVTDVMMPGIDGFELCRRVRSDPRWRSLPILLVTSLASPEDRAAGLDAGADAYVAKVDFDHEDLVGRVRALAGGA